jgi:hypothetical protein
MAAGLGVACRPSPAPRAVAAAPRLYASSLPGRAALVAPALDCTAPMLLPGRRPARRIEATPLHVPASAVGPRISSRPRLALPRAPEEVQALVDVPTLRACYRWARFATPSLQGTAEVVLAIDDYGVVEATFASPAGAGEAAAWADLGACVTSAFRARSLRPLLSAPATTTVPLVFVPSEQAPPRRRPARPALTAVTARRGCVARAPVVELGRAPAVTVDAFDQTLADARTEVVGRTAPVPPVQVGEPVVVRTVPASVVRETIGYQRGAYGACFAAARGGRATRRCGGHAARHRRPGWTAAQSSRAAGDAGAARRRPGARGVPDRGAAGAVDAAKRRRVLRRRLARAGAAARTAAGAAGVGAARTARGRRGARAGAGSPRPGQRLLRRAARTGAGGSTGASVAAGAPDLAARGGAVDR